MASGMARVRHHVGPLRAFRPSMPGLDLSPFEVWRKLEAQHWRRQELPLGYGGAGGYAPLRELLCAYLNASRGCAARPSKSSSPPDRSKPSTCWRSCCWRRARAWLESPGYQGAAAPFEVAGARMCLVPVDAEGMDVGHAATHYPDAAMVFATPSHQLPPGVSMSLARRLALLRWAEANRAWIVEDDYDSEYRYTGPPLASLQSLDRAGCVRLAGPLGEAEPAARATAAGVDLRPLSYYAHPAAGLDCAAPPGMLLGFSAFTPTQIRTGIDRLGQAIAP